MAFRGSMPSKRANASGTLATLVWVPLSVGCAKLDGPLRPDLASDLNRTPGLSSSPGQVSAGERPAVEPDVSPPVDEWVCASDVPEAGQSRETASNTPRGPISITTSCRSVSPLIRIDGVVLPDGCKLSDIGSLDVESVEVLKGASVTALYGPRAANGVIDIRTKRGTQAR